MVTTTMKNLTCSFAVVPDDLLNGNTTANGSTFFTGINKLSQSLDHFDGNFTDINNIISSFESTNTNMSSSITDGKTLMTNIRDIDSNSGNGMSNLTYGSPIN